MGFMLIVSFSAFVTIIRVSDAGLVPCYGAVRSKTKAYARTLGALGPNPSDAAIASITKELEKDLRGLGISRAELAEGSGPLQQCEGMMIREYVKTLKQGLIIITFLIQ